MWRSVARASLSHSRLLSRKLLASSQVLSSQTPIFAPQSSTWVSPKPHLFLNPRFFSIDSSHPTDDNTPQASSAADLNENHDVNAHQVSSEADSIDVHDEYAPQVSSEADFTAVHDPQVSPEADFNVIHDEYDPQVSSEADFSESSDSGIDVKKLESVLSLLQSSVDEPLDSRLDKMGLKAPDEKFMLRALKTPLILGENLIGYYRWASSKEGFVVTPRIVEALVGAVCGGRRVEDAYALWDLIQEIGEKETNVLSVELLNDLIAVFAFLGEGEAAFEVFNKVEELGCVPNAHTYYFTIEALRRRGFFNQASLVCEHMVNSGSLPEDEKIGKIMVWLCKGKKVKDAHLVYMLAKEQNKSLPKDAVSFLIRSLCEEDESVKIALEILEESSENARTKSFSKVVNGLCRAKDIDRAKDLLVKMISEGPPPDKKVFNSIVTGYCKAGDIEKAVEVMRMMESRGWTPDSYTYTLIISGYAKMGQMEEAAKLFTEAQKEGLKLSSVSYHTIIRVHCKLGEFDKALELFDQMKNSGVQPSADEYRKLIRSLCLNALDWRAGERLAKEMETRGLYLYGNIKALIRAVKELEKEGTAAIQATAKA